MKEVNIDISFEMFHYEEEWRGGNGFKEEFTMGNIEAGLRNDGIDPLKGRMDNADGSE